MSQPIHALPEIDHARTDLDVAGQRGDRGQQWHGRRGLLREVVDAEVGPVDANLVGGDGEFDSAPQGFARIEGMAVRAVVAEAQKTGSLDLGVGSEA